MAMNFKFAITSDMDCLPTPDFLMERAITTVSWCQERSSTMHDNSLYSHGSWRCSLLIPVCTLLKEFSFVPVSDKWCNYDDLWLINALIKHKSSIDNFLLLQKTTKSYELVALERPFLSLAWTKALACCDRYCAWNMACKGPSGSGTNNYNESEPVQVPVYNIIKQLTVVTGLHCVLFVE
jgi:hypothetical protein